MLLKNIVLTANETLNIIKGKPSRLTMVPCPVGQASMALLMSSCMQL
jgi:hypothetical protein